MSGIDGNQNTDLGGGLLLEEQTQHLEPGDHERFSH